VARDQITEVNFFFYLILFACFMAIFLNAFLPLRISANYSVPFSTPNED